MEAKIVFKLCYIICLIFFSNMVFAQDKTPKYLLFNGSKDSVIKKITLDITKLMKICLTQTGIKKSTRLI